MAEEEKTFTEEEVNEIVRKRLERYKEKHGTSEEAAQKLADLEAREADLNKRAFKLECAEYVRSKGYDADMLEIIDAEDIDTFKHKADRFSEMIESRPFRSAPPLGNPEMPEESIDDKLSDAFSFGSKHKPKQNY
jgi:hypothetical protein